MLAIFAIDKHHMNVFVEWEDLFANLPIEIKINP